VKPPRRVSVRQQAAVVAIACFVVALAVVLTVNANYQRRRVDLLEQNRKAAADYKSLQDLLDSKTDVATALRDLQDKLRRYVLTVEDTSSTPTDMPGFQFVPVADYEPALVRSLTTLCEYTGCSLSGWSWDPGAKDPGPESAPSADSAGTGTGWQPFGKRADCRRIELRVRGGWSNLQRLVCGLSEFEVPIPDSSPPGFWKFPHLVVVTDLVIRAGSLPDGADPAEAPPLDATLTAKAFRPKPISFTGPAVEDGAEIGGPPPGGGASQPGAGPEPGTETPGGMMGPGGGMGPGGPGYGMPGGGTPGGGMGPGGPGGGMPGGGMGPGGPGGGMPGGGVPGGGMGPGGPGGPGGGEAGTGGGMPGGGMGPGGPGGPGGGEAGTGGARRFRRGNGGTEGGPGGSGFNGGPRRPRGENTQPRDTGGPTT